MTELEEEQSKTAVLVKIMATLIIICFILAGMNVFQFMVYHSGLK